MSGPKTFVTVDGTALAYRSHFAFINRPLTTREGEVTSAVFGFILGLRRILEALEPEALVVVFDASGPTFRHEMYSEYKAQRERMPEDLRSQIPRIHEYLDAAGVPRLAVEGVEADDVMATLARKAADQGMAGRIVSNDKDLLQVVGGDVAVVTLGKSNEPPRVLGPKEVEETFGVSPDQIVDYLALTGDSSDNVPGVPGVGKKTAAKLLQEHGTLDSLLEAVPDMKKSKLKENLDANREEALRSRELVTLRTDLTLDDPATFRPRDPDGEALDRLFAELEFDSLREDVTTSRPCDRSGYSRGVSRRELEALAASLREAERFGFHVLAEGSSPWSAEILGLSFCPAAGRSVYVPLAHPNVTNATAADVRETVGVVLGDTEVAKWGEDLKRARLLMHRLDLALDGDDFDTMLASYVLDPSRRTHRLGDLAREKLGVEVIAPESLTGSGRSRIPLAQAPLTEVAELGAERADVAFTLRERLEPELDATGLGRVLEDLELPLSHVLGGMEIAGVRLDVDYLAGLSARMEKELGVLQQRAWDAAGEEFNLASPKQVSELLFGKLGLKPRRRTKTGLSTSAEVLDELRDDHEVPSLILRHREISKLKSTYVDALPGMVDPETGRIHTSFNQAVAATGRLSSADPNLQNVPVRTEEGRQIRKAFVPREEGWVLVSCDYSQIELRILAHMARDEPLLEAFREDRDVHRATASLIFDVTQEKVTAEQRAQAKTINFAVIYGMGAVNLGRSLGIPTREASRWIEAYFDRYPGVRRFIDETQERAAADLYVETLAGRRRPVPEIASHDHRTRSFGERIAVNTPIQGTAADIMKLAMISVDERLRAGGLRAQMILTVHDELVFDCPEEEREDVVGLVRESMSGAMNLEVPLKVDAGWGGDWSEAH